MSTRLDAPRTSHLSHDQLERLRQLLLNEYNTQQARAVELQDPVDLEPDLAEVLLARCNDAMVEIDAALARIAAGSSGLCLSCQSAIPYERLEIVPAADRCVICQADRDRDFR